MAATITVAASYTTPRDTTLSRASLVHENSRGNALEHTR